MQLELLELRNFLLDEFNRRKNFKSLYSKRAYARDLGLSLTCLNNFLLGKRQLSLKNVEKIFSSFKKRKSVCCSWCGKSKHQAKIIIGGPLSQFICKDCVDVCNEIIRSGRLINQKLI